MASHKRVGCKEYYTPEDFTNTELLPLNVDFPWLYEKSGTCIYRDTGKWMLFYDKKSMNESWLIAKKLYREHQLEGVVSMKCSTMYESSRASGSDGVIILYCLDSSNTESILSVGKRILEAFDYKYKEHIYYKTDVQTREGTRATGQMKNYTYRLFNPLYKIYTNHCPSRRVREMMESASTKEGYCKCGRKDEEGSYGCYRYPSCINDSDWF